MRFQSINKNKKNFVPKIFIRIFYEYSRNNFYIFQKLRHCITPNKFTKIKKIDKNMNFIINKKKKFLISSCKKINQLKIKSGLYRLNWFI